MLHVADDVEPPVLRILLLVLEAPERDPHHDLVAVRREVPLRLVHEVRTQIHWRWPRRGDVVSGGQHAFGDRAVFLHAEWIHGEHQRMPPVHERREDELHVVVAVDQVAVRERRVHRAVRLERADPEVDRGRAVPDEHLRRIRCHPAVDREVLGESVEERGLLPDRRAQRPVDVDLVVEPWDPDVEIALLAIVDQTRDDRIALLRTFCVAWRACIGRRRHGGRHRRGRRASGLERHERRDARHEWRR